MDPFSEGVRHKLITVNFQINSQEMLSVVKKYIYLKNQPFALDSGCSPRGTAASVVMKGSIRSHNICQ